ncbi:alpha/beta hydrolase [Rugosimonospora africana]|uniref:Alpha/beta hydrolase n=1 Tax=Rugosimonospora africana TaxID=556532 RepID=A0A8J3VSF9_9ACTN|nr:alpha/beta fold hydrolase [Rugosimonospora africana]GIH16408.1 alpha/beta hydrolase [Rugosimonospora africana]
MSVEQVQIATGAITQNVLVRGPEDGTPVLLVHGNCSSAGFWLPLLRHLPDSLRVVAPDLRGYGLTDVAAVDATRGLRDFADDVAALLDAPELWPAGVRPVVVGHSIGGGVAMRLAIDHPDRVAALVLEAPVSPYGYGGTRDVDGNPTTPDFAGTGGGSVNPEFVRRLASGDRGEDDQTSPRNVLRATYVADPASLGADEEALLDTMLSTAVGTGNYPGDGSQSPNWPGSGPGTRGVLNAISPRWFRVAEDLVAIDGKPPVLWVHGDADVIVSDTSLFDLAYLGKLGAVPGWPGDDECPPQPMVAQTRAVLDRYAAAGGSYTEVVYDGCGHSPHIERPAEFAAALLKLIAAAF